MIYAVNRVGQHARPDDSLADVRPSCVTKNFRTVEPIESRPLA